MKQVYAPPAPAPKCPSCAADIVSGDRFCQECGTRVSIIRNKRSRDVSSSGDAESSRTAHLICINCGTNNPAQASTCEDCKIPLVEKPIERNPGAESEPVGLRGSLTSKSKRRNRWVPPYATPLKPASPSNLNESSALDFLYPSDEEKNSSKALAPFNRIVQETRNRESRISLSRLIVFIEGLFERVPTPFLFLILSFIIMIVTVNATTHWNRYEQRLMALDKLAGIAEQKMLVYQLDDAINMLEALDRTEKGDLPPRARAVLNQSLWLRSYAHAKVRHYANAIADLSKVTSTFVSYDDVTEKLAEYKQILARHPEFDSQAQSRPVEKAKLKRQKRNTAAAREAEIQEAAPTVSPKIQKRTAKVRTPEASRGPAPNVDKKRGNADLLDDDMKRYSGLLADYFSKAEISRAAGEKATEPPSYEEWTASGKAEF